MHTGCQTSPPLEISVQDAKSRMDAGARSVFIDVREPEEHILARIGDAELIPMGTVPQRLPHFERMADEQETVILFCHHGVRSLHVADWLRHHGVEKAQSMAGGIDAWSRLIDGTVPRY